MQDQSTRKKNAIVMGLIVVIILILAGLGANAFLKKQIPMQPKYDSTWLPSPKTISAFTLTDDTGKPFTNDNLKGHWTFMLFGFSRCGDVCPITLAELNKTYQLWQKDLPASQLPQIAFISVDPQRDTTDVLHNYVKNYNPNFIGASGSADNLEVFVKDMGVYFAKAPGQNDNSYSVQHSSQLFLFNPDGNWVGFFNYPIHAEQLAKKYEAIINKPTALGVQYAQ